MTDMPTLKYNLKPDQLAWVEDILSNGEESSDEELRVYFVANGLADEQAQAVLVHRQDYLLNIYFVGQGPLHEN